MKKMLTQIIKGLSKIITLFNNSLKKLETFLAEDKLILIRTSHHTLGRNLNFILSNHKLLENKELFFQIYMFLMTNKDFLKFGEFKIIFVNGRVKNTTFNLHHNVLIKNDTSFIVYWNKIEDALESITEKGYTVLGVPIIEINVWNMDLYANKKIKITKNVLTKSETFILYNKHTNNIAGVKVKKDSLNKKFYSTKTNFNTNIKKDDKLKKDKDNYLSYITPLKPRKSKSISKVIKIEDKPKKPFSVMDIETLGFNDEEIPITISIKTENNLNLFIIDQTLLKIDVERGIKDL